MITNFKVKNYKTFYEQIEVSFIAQNTIKRFLCNTASINDINILKTIGIYGPNNTGKSCLAKSLIDLKNIMLNKPHEKLNNVFINDDETNYEVEYIINKTIYNYNVIYNSKTNQYVYEELSKINTYNSNKYIKKKITLIKRDNNGQIFYLDNNKLKKLGNISLEFPSVLLTVFNNKELEHAKQDYIEFANSLLFINLENSIDITKTIELSQNDPSFRKFLTQFVKNADLHINDFGYSKNIKSDVDINKMINTSSFPIEYLRFYSNHNGYDVPSFLFDSVGTKKLIALSGYIYDALINGKIVIIDELNNSFHHILSRAIVSIFNNIINTKSQLIFTTHDLMLMDLVHLLRKDQIYLTDIDKNSNRSILKCLKEYPNYQDNGIRGNEDITKYYMKGQFGSIPSIDFYTTIEEIINNAKKKKNSNIM